MAKYLKRFDTHSEYTAYTASTEEYVMPNVSTCYDTKDVHINPYDYARIHFTTVIKSDGIISFSGKTELNTLSYSTDNGNTWSTAMQTHVFTVNAGDKVLWRGTGPTTRDGIGNFTNGTAAFDVEGNVMSLLFGDDFFGKTSLNGRNNAFMGLFSGNTNIISAENLSLPATTLAEFCYYNMFSGCTSLTTTPKLPATTLAHGCYSNMFCNCTSLVKSPELHATTLVTSCYAGMFSYCTSLTTVSELPATTMVQGCYSGMFRGCTSLTSAPKLPAEKLAIVSYSNMFQGCTSLNSITCLATNISATGCTSEWVSNVPSKGIFTKNASMTSWNRGVNGIPTGWTVVDA